MTVPGPVGPYEVLRSEPVPTLFAFQSGGNWTSVSGDPEGLRWLARLADLAGTRQDTVVHLPLRRNGAPPPLAEWVPDDGVLDLVLAPKHVALTPRAWKAVRGRKPTGVRQITLPPLDADMEGPRERLRYRQATRGMDRHMGCGTLILSGDPTTFRGLAAAAAMMAATEWDDWDEHHLDWLQRDDERDVAIQIYDPLRSREPSA